MFCNPFTWLVRLLRWICGLGRKTVERSKDEEQERLLHPGSTPSSTAASQHASTAAVEPSTISQEPITTTIIVLRHGHRQDEEDAFWHQTASRPWDPPLSVKGKVQAEDVASQLSSYSIDYVISSPFRRCLQTSAGIVKQLQLEQGSWLVDWQLSEVCDPRVLFSGRSELRQQASSEAVGTWMWNGLDLTAALEKFSSEDNKLSKVLLRPIARHTAEPHYPEDLNQGLQRYSKALQEIATCYAGKTVLVVTHGECVRMAVLLAEPHSEVFEVKHTGFVVLQHHLPAADGHAGAATAHSQRSNSTSWKLTTEPGETGVLWLEDDED